MPVIHTPDTPYAKEMARHEAIHTKYGAPGRPYQFREYPTRMYLAVRASDGTPTIQGETANDEHERRNLESRGFVHGGQGAAIEALDARETEHGKLAAERAYDVAKGRLSEKAVREVQFVEEAAGAMHVPEIPEGVKVPDAPKIYSSGGPVETVVAKKRGRPRKVD